MFLGLSSVTVRRRLTGVLGWPLLQLFQLLQYGLNPPDSIAPGLPHICASLRVDRVQSQQLFGQQLLQQQVFLIIFLPAESLGLLLQRSHPSHDLLNLRQAGVNGALLPLCSGWGGFRAGWVLNLCFWRDLNRDVCNVMLRLLGLRLLQMWSVHLCELRLRNRQVLCFLQLLLHFLGRVSSEEVLLRSK